MPDAYLFHSVRQSLFQMLALHIPQVSSDWLCSALLGQGHLQGGDLREKEKEHCGGGKYGAQGMTNRGGMR